MQYGTIVREILQSTHLLLINWLACRRQYSTSKCIACRRLQYVTTIIETVPGVARGRQWCSLPDIISHQISASSSQHVLLSAFMLLLLSDHYSLFPQKDLLSVEVARSEVQKKPTKRRAPRSLTSLTTTVKTTRTTLARLTRLQVETKRLSRKTPPQQQSAHQSQPWKKTTLRWRP